MTAGTYLGTPAAEFQIDAALVVSLLADQHPDLASLNVREADTGWDNAMFRLGDALAVRLPRRSVAEPLIRAEQTWLPTVADRLILPVPRPVRIGVPALGYPWHWNVVPWIGGKSIDLKSLAAAGAEDLGRFLRSLHDQPVPAAAPVSPFRGVPLAARAEALAARLRRVEERSGRVSPTIRTLWKTAIDAPIDLPSTWIHGDLHPRNALIDNGGRLTGIVDWGDMGRGDPATDLAAIWMMIEDEADRRAAIDAYGGASEATVARAHGWAVLLGVLLFDSGIIDNTRHAAIGRSILRRLDQSIDGVVVRVSSAQAADAVTLMRELDIELRKRYPGAEFATPQPADLDHARCTVVVARQAGRAVGCGAVRELEPGIGEIKRMYVVPGARSRGVSRQILTALEIEAVKLGLTMMRIETGNQQPEAIGLYRSSGYRDIPPYGEYVDSPASVCFEKAL